MQWLRAGSPPAPRRLLPRVGTLMTIQARIGEVSLSVTVDGRKGGGPQGAPPLPASGVRTLRARCPLRGRRLRQRGHHRQVTSRRRASKTGRRSTRRMGNCGGPPLSARTGAWRAGPSRPRARRKLRARVPLRRFLPLLHLLLLLGALVLVVSRRTPLGSCRWRWTLRGQWRAAMLRCSVLRPLAHRRCGEVRAARVRRWPPRASLLAMPRRRARRPWWPSAFTDR